MRLSRSACALVLFNVAWLAALSWFLVRRSGDGGGTAKVQYVTNHAAFLPSSRPVVVTNVVTAVAATNDFRWAQLETEDYRSYISRLRGIGCPEQTIRDIVIADIDKLLAPKMQAASPRARDLKFWQPVEQEMWEDAEQKEAWRQQRVVDFEKREVIRDLLGVDLVGERLRNQGQDDYHGQRLGFLPEEKRARVRLVLDQFADQERVVLEKQVEEGEGVKGDEETARLRQQKEAALAPLLTPEERQQYDLWFSPAAAAVREEVYGLGATQDEFMQLYQLRQKFVAQQGEAFGPNDPAWKDYVAAIQPLLGEQRFAEYTRAQDPDYRELLRQTSRLKLDPEVAAQLYSYKQPVEEARARIEAEANLTPQQKSAAYQAITDEAQNAFKETLGDTAYQQFMRRTSNPWVRGATGH